MASTATPSMRRAHATPPPRPQARTPRDTVRLLLLEVRLDVLRRRQAHDRVDREVVVDPLVAFEGRDDGCGVGQTRRLEHDRIKLLPFLDESAKRSY